MTISIITDAMNSTPSHDRFEEIVDLLLEANVGELYLVLLEDGLIKKSIEEREKAIDDRFRIDYREMVENALFSMTSLLNHDACIQKFFTSKICDQVVYLLLSYCKREVEKEEHDICTGMYSSSLSCYLIAKFCSKTKSNIDHILKKYDDKSQVGDIVTTLISLVKHRSPMVPVRRSLVMNAYAALSALLQSEQVHFAQRIISFEEEKHAKDYSMVQTIKQDIEGSKSDTEAWELRYSAMVFVKHFAALLQSQQVAAPIFAKLLEAGLLQTMSKQLLNRSTPANQEKSSKKKSAAKQQKIESKQERERFILQRYTFPATLAALNAVIQGTKKNADESNLSLLKDLVAEHAELQHVLQFLAVMDKKKVDPGVPLSVIAALVAVFVLFLISLPLLYNYTRGDRK